RFALGYWAGGRVSDVSWLMKNDVHVGPKVGWLRAGFKNNKAREIDLKNQARRPLFDVLEKGKRKQNRHYIITSERAVRLTEARENDLKNQASRPLFEFLEKGKRKKNSHYIFTSERAVRLTEAGIHHWFRGLKKKATIDQWKLIKDITFHDLRHDFAHRAREA